MSAQILIVEDEVAIREMLTFALKKAEFQITMASDTVQAQHAIAEKPPDLIVLDWMLPSSNGGTSGLEYAKRLKRDGLTKDIPIIMLTARGEEDDRVLGLDSGVDDYVVKPFSPRELISRVRAVLRRGNSTQETLVLGNLTIEAAAQRVVCAGTLVTMGPTEYRLLHFLATRADRVFSRAQLLDYLWSDNPEIEERTVDVQIGRLRKALEPGDCALYIQTVRGSGYRFSLKS